MSCSDASRACPGFLAAPMPPRPDSAHGGSPPAGYLPRAQLPPGWIPGPARSGSANSPALYRLPVHSMTCEGSNDPAEHAEPLEAQIPSKSKPASNGRLSEPSTTNATVFTRRRSREPTNCTPGSRSIRRRRRPVRGASLHRSKTGVCTKRSRASTRPIMPARFSVPARRSFSWLPPSIIGAGCSGDFT